MRAARSGLLRDRKPVFCWVERAKIGDFAKCIQHYWFDFVIFTTIIGFDFSTFVRLIAFDFHKTIRIIDFVFHKIKFRLKRV
jgi:hypothetical protein